MTNRERFAYALSVCLLWALTNWREIALALVVVVVNIWLVVR